MDFNIIETDISDPVFGSLPKHLFPGEQISTSRTERFLTEYMIKSLVLLSNGSPAARLAIFYNPYLHYKGGKAASIGYFESAKGNFADILLRRAEKEILNTGANWIIGPLNGSTWNDYRLNRESQQSCYYLEPCFPVYYNRLFLNSGYEQVASYYSGIASITEEKLPEITQLETLFKEKGISIRSIRIKDFDYELKRLFKFLPEAFKSNFLFTPISWESFYLKYGQVKKVIDPDLVLIAETSSKEIAGCVFSFIDPLSVEKRLVIKTLARFPGKEFAGLGKVMANRIINKAAQYGAKSVIHALMIENGPSIETSRQFHGEVFRNYSLYGKKVTSPEN